MTLLQTYECRAELAELDGIDALGEAVEGDGAAFDGGLDDTYALEVVDADGGLLYPIECDWDNTSDGITISHASHGNLIFIEGELDHSIRTGVFWLQ